MTELFKMPVVVRYYQVELWLIILRTEEELCYTIYIFKCLIGLQLHADKCKDLICAQINRYPLHILSEEWAYYTSVKIAKH